MAPRDLLDTHIVIRWLADPKRLSRDQARILTEAVRRRETVAISAITLLEVAMFSDGPLRMKLSLQELFRELEESPVFRILPLTIDIAMEAASLGAVLRDPADRVIAATARVHGLRLLTSDQGIIESNLVSVVP
ncbi:MAG: type II toxin-antitoxin system VapC family toxin [Acidobacteriia bacterium]|nr:type II toxin-antitoxin system VapC family toxin [Terriglobia bacterium]